METHGGDENVTIYKRLITYYYYRNRYMREMRIDTVGKCVMGTYIQINT